MGILNTAWAESDSLRDPSRHGSSSTGRGMSASYGAEEREANRLRLLAAMEGDGCPPCPAPKVALSKRAKTFSKPENVYAAWKPALPEGHKIELFCNWSLLMTLSYTSGGIASAFEARVLMPTKYSRANRDNADALMADMPADWAAAWAVLLEKVKTAV